MDLFVSCIVLCVSSLLAGWAPLFVHAPAKRRWLSTMGVGVLIGSAFVNVLPEAIHTTYLQPRHAHAAQHRRLMPTMHPSGVPAMASSDASSPAIGAWNPLSSIAASTPQSGSEEAALHKFKVNRGAAAAATPQAAATTSGTATRKLANSNAQRQRHLLAADEPAATKATEEHSHEGHDHSHAGHSHAEAAPPAPPAPVTSPRLVDDEAAIGSHILHRLAPAVPSTLMFASSSEAGAATDAAPEQLLACFGEDHPSKYMGALLALGFVAMLLVDRCAGRRSSPLPSVSSDDIESAPMLPAVPSSSRSNQAEGVELMSRQKSSPGLASPGLGGSGGSNSGGNGAASSSSVSTSHGTTPRTKVGSSSGSGGGSAHPTPVGGGTASTGLSFPSVHNIASAHSHGGSSGSGGGGGHSHSPSASSALSSLSASPTAASSSAARAAGAGSAPAYSLASDLHVLLGVVVYALVDGLSLGAEALGSPPVASAAAPDSPLSLLLPRAPLAFGVSCFLMFQSRASTKTIQKLALLYAAITPVSAVATWTALASWPAESGAALDPLSLPLGFGVLGLTKLFAAGALLFTIAVHILPEIQAAHGGAHHGGATAAAGAVAAGSAGVAGHGHGGDGSVVSPGSASSSSSSSSSNLQVPPGMSVRGSSPSAAASRGHEEHHPLLGVSSSHAGLVQSAAAEEGKSMPWRYVVALIAGLLTPLLLACMHTPKILR